MILSSSDLQQIMIFLNTAPGACTEDRCRATWRRILDILTGPDYDNANFLSIFELLQDLISNGPPAFLLAGPTEHAYQTLTHAVAKAIGRPSDSISPSDPFLSGITYAGLTFASLLGSYPYPWNMRFVVGLFEGETDWVSALRSFPTNISFLD